MTRRCPQERRSAPHASSPCSDITRETGPGAPSGSGSSGWEAGLKTGGLSNLYSKRLGPVYISIRWDVPGCLVPGTAPGLVPNSRLSSLAPASHAHAPCTITHGQDPHGGGGGCRTPVSLAASPPGTDSKSRRLNSLRCDVTEGHTPSTSAFRMKTNFTCQAPDYRDPWSILVLI